MVDAYAQNRAAWNQAVADGNMWTKPFSPEVIAAARRGDWSLIVTPTTPVPRAWFGEVAGKDVLTLASGGGQQAPVLAAAGARVTSFDASDEQLAQDRFVAHRENLSLRTVQGDMRNLSALESGSFDLVFNPCSTCFVEEVEPVWHEVARVLRKGGALITGFVNPWFYLFDENKFDRGELSIVNKLPYRDPDTRDMIEFSHTLDTQLGGQLRAGLMLTDMFEDEWDAWKPLLGVAKPFIATRAVKK